MWIIIIIFAVLISVFGYFLKTKGPRWVFKYNMASRMDDYIIQTKNDSCALPAYRFGYDTYFCNYSNMFENNWIFMKYGEDDEVFEVFTNKKVLFPIVRSYSYRMEDLKNPTARYYKNMANYFNDVKYNPNLDKYKQLLTEFIDDQNKKYLDQSTSLK